MVMDGRWEQKLNRLIKRLGVEQQLYTTGRRERFECCREIVGGLLDGRRQGKEGGGLE